MDETLEAVAELVIPGQATTEGTDPDLTPPILVQAHDSVCRQRTGPVG